MSNGTFNIRQAARWANRTGNFTRGTDEHGNPNYTYAVYSLDTHEVAKVSDYDTCRRIAGELGAGWDHIALDEVYEQLCESEGEAACIPEASEMREWA